MFKPRLETLLLFFVSLTLLAGQIFARTAGALDNSFGAGGVALHHIGNGGIEDMAVQADGKILVGGSGDPNSFVIVRFNRDGSLDTTFGTSGTGVVRTEVFTVDNLGSYLRGLTIQPDGKIIAAGAATRGRFVPKGSPIFTEIAVVRYHPNGTLDTTFDGDGKFTTLFNGGSARAEAVDLQPDGKIVLAAWNSGEVNNFITLRLNPNGAPDASFDGDGMAVTNFGLGSRPQDLKIQPDGKILVAGYYQTNLAPGGAAFAVARYNPNGTLDATFDGDGKASANVSGADRAYGLTLQPDGKIIVAGTAQLNFDSPQNFGVVRLNADGSLDNSFDGDGRVTTTFVNGQSAARDVAVQPDGRIVVVGTTATPSFVRSFAIARYLPNGALDPTFDGDGKVTTLIFSEASAAAVAFQSDGKILVGGYAFSNGVYAMVARYLSRADASFDFDGDHRADISLFRPSDATWYMLRSNQGFTAHQFGISTDKPAPADFDGDGKTDIAVFRSGVWYRLNSSNNSFSAAQFGAGGDLPVPGDYDGDGRADLAVFRPSDGTWYRINSFNGQFAATQFGAGGDKPQVADFDGDGKTDLAVFRPAEGNWYILHSSNNSFAGVHFGISEDVATPADFDGDGKTDLAVYRPSEGRWFWINSGSSQFASAQFGVAEDKPAAADYDGDSRADIAVFRPSTGTWYLLRSTAGFTGVRFGAGGDIPAAAAFGR
jgi:uncharacterized delta-60 repeat protein